MNTTSFQKRHIGPNEIDKKAKVIGAGRLQKEETRTEQNRKQNQVIHDENNLLGELIGASIGIEFRK